MINTIKSYFIFIWSWSLSLIIWLVGGFDAQILSLVALMGIDFLTGLWVGYKKETLNSNRAYKGIQKKIMILALFSGSSIMSRLIPGAGIRNLVAMFYCVTELLSIIENAAKAGVPIPEKFIKTLEQLKNS